MATNKVIVTKSKLDSLANVINAKAGTTGAKTLAQMEQAVNGISGGGGVSGDVKQYQVNKGQTITEGDFVEIVQKWGANNFSSSPIYSTNIFQFSPTSFGIVYYTQDTTRKWFLAFLNIVNGAATIIKTLEIPFNYYASEKNINLINNSTFSIVAENDESPKKYKAFFFEIGENSITLINEFLIKEFRDGNKEASSFVIGDKLLYSYRYGANYYIYLGAIDISNINSPIKLNEIEVGYNDKTDFNDGCFLKITNDKFCFATGQYYVANKNFVNLYSVNDGGIKYLSRLTIPNKQIEKMYKMSDKKIFVSTGFDSYTIDILDNQLVNISARLDTNGWAGKWEYAPLSENKVLAFEVNSNGDAYFSYYNINGSSITQTNKTYLYRNPSGQDIYYPSMLLTSSSSALLVFAKSSGVFRTIIPEENQIIIQDNSNVDNGIFVQKAKGLTFSVGVAKTGGTENQIVDVYVPFDN